MEDEQIVELYLRRDERALRETELKYGARILSLCQNILSSRQDAEDAQNDTWLQTWNSIPPHEPRNYFFAFLCRVARHICLDKYRYERREKRSVPYVELTQEMEECIPAPDDVESRLDDMAIKEALDGFLSSLDETKRAIFLRRYWYMDSVSSIAARFGARQGKIKMILLRTRNELKAYLKKEGIDL